MWFFILLKARYQIIWFDYDYLTEITMSIHSTSCLHNEGNLLNPQSFFNTDFRFKSWLCWIVIFQQIFLWKVYYFFVVFFSYFVCFIFRLLFKAILIVCSFAHTHAYTYTHKQRYLYIDVYGRKYWKCIGMRCFKWNMLVKTVRGCKNI